VTLVAVDVYVKDTSLLHNPIAGVVVRAFNAAGSQGLTQTTTDVAGHAGLMLEDATTYQLRFFKQNVGFSNPKYVDVLVSPGVNTFDVQGELFTPPAAVDPRLCRASGFFRTVTGAAAAGVSIHFIAKFDPLLLEGAAVLTEREFFRTDARGYAEVDLIRNGHYDVTIEGMEDFQRTIYVPDAASVNLPDLLFPVVATVSFDPPGPWALTAGDPALGVTPTILSTDGRSLQLSAGDVYWTTSDKAVFDIAYSPTQLFLRPVSAGSAELRAARSDTSIIRIPDTPIAGQPVAVTVT
jgi:hypothetical protein